jgi:type IV secretory pathway VirB2 component (pilin)
MTTKESPVRRAAGLFLVLALLALATVRTPGGSMAAPAAPADAAAVESVVRDYIEGWYTGDVARMDRALHEDLVKRMPVAGEREMQLHPVSKARMMEMTAGGGGENPEAAFEIVVDHVSGPIASARVTSPEYLDYLHLTKSGEEWKIVNVLFRTLD